MRSNATIAGIRRLHASRHVNCATIIFVTAFAGIFWSLRWYYWSITFEEPFSDIADYIVVANRIVNHFSFGVSDTMYSYYTPITPSFIAVSILLGGDNYQLAFRYLVQTVTFVGSLFLAYEIVKLTGRRWLGAALLLVVSLSRPSIFWSLKLGTEAVTEALLISAIAINFRALRTRSPVCAIAAGAVCVLLALNRPQWVPSVFAVAACFGFAAFGFRMRREGSNMQGIISLRDRTRLWQAACFVAGALLVWSPWIVRNYLHYGAFIPTATSGVEAFVWESGGAPLTPGRYQELHLSDGTVWRNFAITDIRASLADSPNDYERSKSFRLMATAWLWANLEDLPSLFARRLMHFISHSGANDLTTVPRGHLFPTSADDFQLIALDRILLDKNSWICALAFGGVVLLIIRYGVFGYTIASLCLLPWFVLAAVIGHERTVESLISITIWLAVYFASEAIVVALSLWRLTGTYGKGA